MLKKRALIISLMFLFMVLGVALCYSYYPHFKTNIPVQTYYSSIKILDSTQINVNAENNTGKWTYYPQKQIWVLNSLYHAKIFDKNFNLLHTIRGQVKEMCPKPDDKYSSSQPVRVGAFGMGNNTMVVYDDLYQNIFVYDATSYKIIKKIKPDFKNKRYWGSCLSYNNIETNDSIAILMLKSVSKDVKTIYETDKKVLTLFNLKTGKTIRNFGQYDEIYREKKHLNYLEYYRFKADFENQRVFYQFHASPNIYEYNWKTGQEKVFGKPVKEYTKPEKTIPDSLFFTPEGMGLQNKYKKECFLHDDLYYDNNKKLLYRLVLKPITGNKHVKKSIIQVYNLNNYELIGEAELPESVYYISYVDENGVVWCITHPHSGNITLYKITLIQS